MVFAWLWPVCDQSEENGEETELTGIMCAHVHEQPSGPAKYGQWDQPAHSSHRNQFRRLLAKTNVGLWVYIGCTSSSSLWSMANALGNTD